MSILNGGGLRFLTSLVQRLALCIASGQHATGSLDVGALSSEGSRLSPKECLVSSIKNVFSLRNGKALENWR